MKISALLKSICILWINFGIDVISLQLWPGHNGCDHHRWSLWILFSRVYYYIIDLSVRVILNGANTGDGVETRQSNKECRVFLMISSVSIFDHYNCGIPGMESNGIMYSGVMLSLTSCMEWIFEYTFWHRRNKPWIIYLLLDLTWRCEQGKVRTILSRHFT